MKPTEIYIEKLNSVIKKRLTGAPPDAKSSFPKILKEKLVSWAFISESKYFLVVFLNAAEQSRIADFIKKNLNPFPGLITTGNEGAAFKVENSRYLVVKSNNVSNSFAFSLGPDSTILLEDHRQGIKTKDFGQVDYLIPLAYILSYGDEINETTLPEYFEGLVAHSINLWMKENG
ncbi:hypothetical protein KA005_26730 [bacterium]|nr:hypothetical protein [bacterium]